jgi:enoyl-CoA hydratase/carnithine racemase
MSYQKFPKFKLNRAEEIRMLTVNNPPKLKTLSDEVIKELAKAAGCEENGSEVKIVVVTSNAKMFVAADDIAYLGLRIKTRHGVE